MNIVDYIPYGSDHPVTRQELVNRTGLGDREVRRAISEARIMFPIINLSNGRGYYIATDNNDIEAKRFYRQELSRIRSLRKNLDAVKEIINKSYDGKQMAGQYSLYL